MNKMQMLLYQPTVKVDRRIAISRHNVKQDVVRQ